MTMRVRLFLAQFIIVWNCILNGYILEVPLRVELQRKKDANQYSKHEFEWTFIENDPKIVNGPNYNLLLFYWTTV